MKKFLALDLGTFKTVSYLLTRNHDSMPFFKTIMTNPKAFEKLLLDPKRSLHIFDACGFPAGASI